MLKKLTTLSLSLLLCASALPAQAGAMDAPEDVPPVQVEECEDPDAGIAPCASAPQDSSGGGGGQGEPGPPPRSPFDWPPA